MRVIRYCNQEKCSLLSQDMLAELRTIRFLCEDSRLRTDMPASYQNWVSCV